MKTFCPLLCVCPSRVAGERDLPALETAMQGLALDARSPIALELAATTTTRQFLLRAEQRVALQHLARQIQARYPQALIQPVASDPLTLASQEACSVIELRPGAASYLPLRSWRPRDLLAEGADPLLGLLAACGSLPSGVRAVAQLALLPVSPTWSAGQRRYAVEHPLEQEHVQARQRMQGPQMAQVLLLLPVVLALLLVYAFRQRVPHWLLQAGALLLRGQAPHLTLSQIFVVVAGIGGLLLLLLAGIFVSSLSTDRLRAARIYDQRLVAEKTARSAYRVRLRLFVIAPDTSLPTPQVTPVISLSKQCIQALFMYLCRLCVLIRTHRRRLREIKGTQHRLRALIAVLRAIWHLWGRRFREVWRRLYTYWRVQYQRLQERQACRLEREDVLRMLTAAYRQYHLAAGGYFVPRHLSPRHVLRLLAPSTQGWFGRIRRTGWTCDLRRSTHYLSVADLAALWHLPQAQDLPDLSYVERETARTLLAPAVLSTGNGYPLGISTHAGQTSPVFLPFSCLRHNLLIAASTGKGKSNLLEHFTRAFALARVSGQPEGHGGVLFVDPHGDQVEHISGSLPARLLDDIVLIRLADREYPIGFNPLDMSQGQDRDKIIDNLIQVVEALWPTSYGPRTESFVEYGCKTLAEANLTLITNDPLHGPEQQFTLLDVVPLLRQESFRHAIFELVRDQHLLNWWKRYYEQLDGRQQAEFTSSVVTKMSKFASSRISRRILGQPRSSLNFTDLIRQNKIVLISCAAGDVGADLATLFGSLLIGFFQTALAEQARFHPEERHHFLVLIDEFQTLKVDYQTMLAELRKYGGSFALATQSLAYLDRFERTLRATVLANIDQVFAFAMANDDARLLHLPGIEPEDLTHLPDYTCYARLSLAGQRLPVFSMRLHAPELPNEEVQRGTLSQSRLRYGRPLGVVEQALLESETRQRTMKPTRPRKGAKGYDVLWSGSEEERVRDVFDTMNAHQRGQGGSSGTRKGTRVNSEDATTPAYHTMYPSGSEEVEAPVNTSVEGKTDAIE